MYAYAANNPVHYIDPDGCYPRKPTPSMGVQSHNAIISNLKSQDRQNGVIGGAQLYLPNPFGGKKGGFFVDYQRVDANGNKEFYEIKPISYMNNKRGDRQLEKYIERDGNAIKGMELLSEIAVMDPIETVMNTPLGVEKMSINLTVDPVNHPGMIFYELDDGRTSHEEAFEVLKAITKPLVNAALILAGSGGQITIPEPALLIP